MKPLIRNRIKIDLPEPDIYKFQKLTQEINDGIFSILFDNNLDLKFSTFRISNIIENGIIKGYMIVSLYDAKQKQLCKIHDISKDRLVDQLMKVILEHNLNVKIKKEYDDSHYNISPEDYHFFKSDHINPLVFRFECNYNETILGAIVKNFNISEYLKKQIDDLM